MNKTKPYFQGLLVVLSLFLASLGLTTQGFAQSAGGAFKGIGNNDDPIQIEADKLEILNDVFRATLNGNVTIIQGNAIIQAQKVIVFYLPEDQKNRTGTGIREIIASGIVAIKSGKNHATGERLEINFLSETAVLSGKEIILSQGLNAIKGCQLTVELTTGNSKFGKCRTSIIALPNTKKN